MSEHAAAIVCVRCGQEAARVVSMPRVKVQPTSESPKESVRRLQGTKRDTQFYDSPFTNKRIYKRGSKKEFESAIKKDVVESSYGKLMDIKESEVTPTNL